MERNAMIDHENGTERTFSKIDANGLARDNGPGAVKRKTLQLQENAKRSRNVNPASETDSRADLGDQTEEVESTNTTNTTNADSGWNAPIPLDFCGRLPLFPTSAMTGWVGEMVNAVSVATQTPPDLAGGLALAVVALSCAKKHIVSLSQDWKEPLNLYTVTTLDSGNRKSSVFNLMTAPIEAWEQMESTNFKPKIASARATQEITEQRLKECKAIAAKEQDSLKRAKYISDAEDLAIALADIQIPHAPQLFCDDATPEAIGHLLHEQGGRMAVLSSEGDIYEIMAGRYSEKANIGVFLKGHAGDTLRVDRIGRPPEYVPSPALTIGLCVQSEVIQGLSQKPGFRGRGLLGRFLYSLPKSTLGSRELDPPPIPARVLHAYSQNLSVLLSKPWDKNENDEPCPIFLRLSPEANEIFNSLRRTWEPKLGAGGELAGITDWASKLPGAIARIAGGLQLSQDPLSTLVSGETMAAAIQIGEYYTAHAVAAFCLMGADPSTETAKRILGWIERKGCPHFQRRDLQQDLRIKSADQTPALNLLTEHEYIRPIESNHFGSGRKPLGPNSFNVNPRIRAVVR